MKRVVVFILLSGVALAQGGRFDSVAQTTATIGGVPGIVQTVPNASIRVCAFTNLPTVPCASPATTYTDYTLSTPCISSTQVVLSNTNQCVSAADGNGNFGFWLPYGQYIYQVSAAGVATQTYWLSVGVSGSSSLLVYNLDNIIFVDGVKYLTIDAAIAALGAGPGIVIIPSTYAGAESSNLVTIDGQTRYCGQDNITVWDMRGGVEHNYNQNWGGTVLGSLSRQAITQCKISPIHTTSASLVTNYVTGAMPPDLGTVAGLTTQVTIYGTATPQAGGHVAGFEAYTELVPTNVATWADVRAATFSVNIDRTTAKGNITDANGVYAGPCINTSTSGATITNCYSFHAGQPTVGTARNYSAFFEGSTLQSNNVNYDMIDGSGTPQHIFTPTPSNDLFMHGLADTHGVIFATAAGATEMQINSLGMSLALPMLKYNGISTVGNGVPSEYGTVDLTAQGANIGSATLYATPASGGLYRVVCYIIETTAATTSSTLPSCVIGYTDFDNSTVQSQTFSSASPTGNSLTTLNQSTVVFKAKGSTNITYSTTGYATSGATSMQYAIHIRLEAM